MSFTSLAIAISFASTVFASIGPTADLTLTNGAVSPDGFARQAVLVNGQVPGPLIVANKGEDFNLNVIDTLTDATMLTSTSIHWHGFFQKNSSWADGPAFVTQCPIAPDNSFLYTFATAGQAGTFWYHSHLSTQYCDGLRGLARTNQSALSILPHIPLVYDKNDPHLSLYDVDDDHGAASTLGAIPTLVSTLFNGLGRFANGPTSQLAVISVEKGKRYRIRLVSISCDPNFTVTIDGHKMTIIEVDSENVQPLTVDSIQIFAGMRYSFVLNADQAKDNYWIRSVANGGTKGFANGINSAILRYVGADEVDPVTTITTSTAPLVETDLRPLNPPGVPGLPVAGGADVNLNLVISLDFASFTFKVNGAAYKPPTAPVLLQILSGAQTATDLLPNGSVFVLPPNKVIEISIPGGSPGAPHPFHLHGHNFHVVKSAGNSTFNFVNPVIRDVVSTGSATTDNTTIRFVTDNAGPWFLHCHIDFHLEIGLAVVFAEDTATVATSKAQTLAWDQLCPTFNALP
ncbi:laccase [Mycena rebaudengoi]|nr:laccase [Mycena rebaudengoi]